MSPSDSLEILQLQRRSEPAMVAAHAVRRLVHAVSEWSDGSSLEITFATRDGRRVLVFEQAGGHTSDWKDDVRWALDGIGTVANTRGIREELPRIAAALEIVPTRTLHPNFSTGFDTTIASLDGIPERGSAEGLRGMDERRLSARAVTPWPEPMATSLLETAELLASDPLLMIRFQLASASESERDMLGDALVRTWTGSDSELAAYLGTPVRMRAMIAAVRGRNQVPARFRATTRRWAQGLSLVPLSDESMRNTWRGGPDELIGHVVPEGVALSIVRLPAAGNASFPGMATAHRAAVPVPLDPVPEQPARPLRLGTATTVSGASVDVSLDIGDLTQHSFIEGRPGAGKSTLLALLAREIMQQGYSCTLLDPHGTTIDQILAELPEQAEKVYVVRHEDAEHPVPVDIMTGDQDEVERMIDSFIEMVQEMYDPKQAGIVGPRWRRWFGLIARATQLVLGERASLVAIADIGGDRDLVSKLASAVEPLDRGLSRSIMSEIVENRSSEAAEVLSWCVSKLQPLVATRQMRATLGTGHDAVDVRELMDSGTTLLVDLASPTLGVPSARTLGALWIQKHWNAMGRRTRADRPHVIIVDEAHLFQYGALPNLLAEARKFGIGVVVATQYMGQLREDLAESLSTNAGSLFTLATGLPFAVQSSVRLGGWPVEQIVRIPKLTAAVAISREGTRTEPFTLKIDHHERMTALGARSPEARRRAEEAVRGSLQDLWAPYAAAVPMTPERAKEELEALIRARRVAEQSRSSRVRAASDGDDFLEGWLAKKRTLPPRGPRPGGPGRGDPGAGGS